MHSCPECDAPCYCDMDDTDLGLAGPDCTHVCEAEPDEPDYGSDDDMPCACHPANGEGCTICASGSAGGGT